jgi:hypothetical protein
LMLFDAVTAGEAAVIDYTPGSVSDANGNPLTSFGTPLTNLLVTIASDATGLLQVWKAPPILNPLSRQWVQLVLVRNPTPQAFSGPLSYVVEGLASGVAVLNQAGTTECTSPLGAPYVNVPIGADDRLEPGEVRLFALALRKTSRHDIINYSHRLLLGPGCR